ncbi:MAG TPA: RsmD family RNA methyltransferase [Rhizomicrobium sp.]|nr:RsmD family RNA methyltransferase [Rhizomicrobium sp.]
MRVTGGKLGGRRLVAPENRLVRPTSDRARQAIFNILEHHKFGIGFTVENAAVADLFAGTGALGIEALSRGARFCLLVDNDAESRALQRENVEALGLTGVTKIWRRDATDLGPLGGGALPREAGTGSRQATRPNKNPAGGPFDLVFLDPPYRRNLVAPALASLRGGGWLSENALLVIETAKGETFTHDGYAQLDARNYGDTDVVFLTAPK